MEVPSFSGDSFIVRIYLPRRRWRMKYSNHLSKMPDWLFLFVLTDSSFILFSLITITWYDYLGDLKRVPRRQLPVSSTTTASESASEGNEKSETITDQQRTTQILRNTSKSLLHLREDDDISSSSHLSHHHLHRRLYDEDNDGEWLTSLQRGIKRSPSSFSMMHHPSGYYYHRGYQDYQDYHHPSHQQQHLYSRYDRYYDQFPPATHLRHVHQRVSQVQRQDSFPSSTSGSVIGRDDRGSPSTTTAASLQSIYPMYASHPQYSHHQIHPHMTHSSTSSTLTPEGRILEDPHSSHNTLPLTRHHRVKRPQQLPLVSSNHDNLMVSYTASQSQQHLPRTRSANISSLTTSQQNPHQQTTEAVVHQRHYTPTDRMSERTSVTEHRSRSRSRRGFRHFQPHLNKQEIVQTNTTESQQVRETSKQPLQPNQQHRRQHRSAEKHHQQPEDTLSKTQSNFSSNEVENRSVVLQGESRGGSSSRVTAVSGISGRTSPMTQRIFQGMSPMSYYAFLEESSQGHSLPPYFRMRGTVTPTTNSEFESQQLHCRQKKQQYDPDMSSHRHGDDQRWWSSWQIITLPD